MHVDLLTRKWWRAVGRPVDLDGEHAWLASPMSAASTVADGWTRSLAAELGGEVHDDVPGAGLIPDLASLDGPGFAATALRREIRDFYEHTADWRMDVWTAWAPWAWPGGVLLSSAFGKRIRQLALPTRPLDVAHGMDSRVSVITGATGDQHAAAWIRTLRATGEVAYSGCYSTRTLPGADRASVHVAFPLENGNVQVFLRPFADADGTLWLRSPRGPFGSDGAYVVVRDGGRTFAARVPLHETFRLFVDHEGTLRTDHVLRVWRPTAVRLHYKLEPR